MTPEEQALALKRTMGVLLSMAEEDAADEARATAEVEAMSAEERQAWLRSHGVDPGRVRARALEARRRARASSKSAPTQTSVTEAKATAKEKAASAEGADRASSDLEAPPVAREASRPSRATQGRRAELTWLLAAATATAVGGAVAAAYYARHDEPPPPRPPVDHEPTPPSPPDDPVAMAAKLRADAARACEERRWSECLGALDAAKTKDPAGDGNAEWQALRARAVAGRDGEKTGGGSKSPPGR